MMTLVSLLLATSGEYRCGLQDGTTVSVAGDYVAIFSDLDGSGKRAGGPTAACLATRGVFTMAGMRAGFLHDFLPMASSS